jgi:hypothetical protein
LQRRYSNVPATVPAVLAHPKIPAVQSFEIQYKKIEIFNEIIQRLVFEAASIVVKKYTSFKFQQNNLPRDFLLGQRLVYCLHVPRFCRIPAREKKSTHMK